MKKVLIITNNTNPNSGWGRYSSEIIKNLEKRNRFQIEVLTEEVYENGFKFEKPILKPVKNLLSLLTNTYIARKEAKDCEIVHAFDGWPYAFYAYMATLCTNKKLFINGVGTYSVAPLKRGIRGLMLKCIYQKAIQIFCISKYVADEITKLVPKAQVSVVHMGLNILLQPTSEEISSVIRIYNISKGFPNILTVGAIKNRKGQFDTVRAIKLLKEKYPNIKYWIVGSDRDTKYVNKIKNYLERENLLENVQLFSNVKTDKELACFYNLANVFVLSSRNEDNHFEGFGLVIIEAGQFGVPAVGSKGCGIEDAIIDNKTGYLVEQGNTEAIASAIEKALTIDKKNVTEFARSFSWDKNVDFYLRYYNN